MQVYSVISRLKTYHPTLHFTPLVTGPAHSCAISTQRRAYSPAAISAHWTYRTHCHLYPTWFSFLPESSEAFEGEVPFLRAQHRNNVPRLRGEKHDFSLKILQEAGFETARQEATLSKRHALAIASCPSLWKYTYVCFVTFGRSSACIAYIIPTTPPADLYVALPKSELLVRPHHDKIDDAKLK